ncbi:hypothetical protein ABZ746_13630 [Streptomyces sp. NPDC020096]
MGELSIPELCVPLSGTGVNPRVEEAARSAYAWADSFGLIPGSVPDHMDRGRFELLSGLYYPTADTETFDLVTQWIVWGTIFDEVMDDGLAEEDPAVSRSAISQALACMELGQHAAPSVIQALDELWRRTSAGRSEDWKRSFIGHWREGWRSSYATLIDRVSGRTPPLAEYMERRRYDIKMLPCADLLEITEHIDLPEYVRHLPALESLHNLTADYAGLVNDLVSGEKDLAAGGAHNVMTVLRAQEHCTMQEAIDRTGEMATACVRAYLAAERDVSEQLNATGATGRQRAEAIRYARSHRATFNGNREWHLTVPRYAQVHSVSDDMRTTYAMDLQKTLRDGSVPAH